MSTRARTKPAAWFGLLPAAVAAILAIAILSRASSRGDRTPAAPTYSVPSPTPVPAASSALRQVGTGPVIGWVMSEPLVGPRDVAIDADGTVWITEQNRGIVDSFVGGTLVRHMTNAFPDTGAFALSAGPGGMWFTAYPGGTVGRVLPDGRANVFDALAPDAATLGIASGPGGVVWVTDVHRGLLLRIRPDGVVDQIPVPPVGGRPAAPRDIVRGPDDAMWFTDPVTRTVGRIGTNGGASPEQLPLVAAPRSIAAGAGAIWVTLPKAESLARIDPNDHGIEVIPLPDASGPLNDLVVDDDGSIWVTQESQEILHIRDDGTTIARYLLPGGASYADGIAIGPDGTVWATAGDANMIVSITA